ncbi:MAG: SET domain-containing protein [Burkholderiales bacterium]
MAAHQKDARTGHSNRKATSTKSTRRKPASASAGPRSRSAAAKPIRYYVVRNSPIHGRGVFAARTIRGKQTIIEYRGERTTWDDANARPPSDPDNPYHTFLFGLDDGRVIDADVRGNAARWINHSCRPNCETYEDDKGRVFIAARRRIERGEELTYDYQLTWEGRMGKKMRAAYTCRCGARRCRGTMLAKK